MRHAVGFRTRCCTRAVRVPTDGYVTVKTFGPDSSDWDVGIVDRKTRRTLNGAAGLGSTEVASTQVRKGQRLSVQLCRRSGTAASIRVRVQFTKVDLTESSYRVRLVRVKVASAAARARLDALGLDTADHAAPKHWDVLLHSRRDARRLRRAGFKFTVRIADLARHDRANRLRERRARIAQATSALPSGRTQYRTLPEIQDEMKDYAQRYPQLVRVFELPLHTFENRPIMGMEIARNVTDTTDGRPTYVQIGTHHAREWPANEAALEFGIELIKNYTRDATYNRGFDARLDSIVENGRTIVVPVMNVDGFDVTIESEGLNPDGSYEDPVDSGGSSGDQGNGSGAYKRKTCTDHDEPANEAIPCIARTSYLATPDPTDGPDDPADRGVDPNRNYGVEWGGPGTASDPEDLTYHGPNAWSEAETESVRRFIRDRQPAVLITNHTFTGLMLRPPGTSDFGPTPDETRMRILGDAMAAEVEYISQYSYQLYDTTGTTDDYLYDGLGAFSYTPEIGKAEFHPEFTSGFVPEYDGRPATDANGEPTGDKLGGLREAYTLAGLAAIDPDSHSVISGTAPAGRTLRISKTITYDTSARPDDNGEMPDDNPQTISEPRQSTLVVGANGQFTWHVNPSNQPRRSEVTPWTLTCEDGSGNVLETKQVHVARDQAVQVGLTCGGAGAAPPPPAGETTEVCTEADGFRRVSVKRRGRGLRLSFRRKVSNPVEITIFRTSAGRKINKLKRVKRYRNRTRASRGRRAARSAASTTCASGSADARERVDTRRIVVERKSKRFVKRGGFHLIPSCPG